MTGNAFESARHIPSLEEFQEGGRRSGQPTKKFISEYKHEEQYVREVFPPEDNPGIIYPPASPEEFIGLFRDSPDIHRYFSQEIWTLMNQIDRNEGILNKKKLYPHQRAHGRWVALTLPHGKDSPSSLFLEGAPGTGKTLTLGMLLSAAIRLQLRGLLEGKIAYLTAKSHHLSDKVYGRGESRQRVLRAPPYEMTEKDFKRQRRLFEKIDPFYAHYVSNEVWERLFVLRSTPAVQVMAFLEGEIDERSLREDFTSEGEEGKEMLRSLACVVSGQATLVSKGLYRRPEVLHLSQPPSTSDEELQAYTGDASFAIPRDYPVHSRQSVGISTATPEDARVVLETANFFTSATPINHPRDEARRTMEIVFCDEAGRREPMAIQEPVISAGAHTPPIVIAAGSRWHEKKYDRRSPRHSYMESIRQGVLPNFGVRLFPSASEVHFPSETREALEQLCTMYFRDLPYFRQLKLPQPYDVNSLFVVHSNLFDVVTERLRREYEERKMREAEVYIYDGTDEDREALRIWLDDAERGGPHVLVASPSVIQESIDFPTLRHLVIGCTVSPDKLYHLVGRLAHGRDIRKEEDRMILTLQQFANSNVRVTPFTVLDHGLQFGDNEFSWIQGHALMNQAAYETDRRRTRRKGKSLGSVTVPSTAHRKKGDPYPIVVQGGHSLIHGKGYVHPRIEYLASIHVASATRRIPIVSDREDSRSNGPPSRDVVRIWAGEFDAGDLCDTY